jgi:hypothetical protein
MTLWFIALCLLYRAVDSSVSRNRPRSSLRIQFLVLPNVLLRRSLVRISVPRHVLISCDFPQSLQINCGATISSFHILANSQSSHQFYTAQINSLNNSRSSLTPPTQWCRVFLTARLVKKFLERIVLLDFIHRLVSQEKTKLRN